LCRALASRSRFGDGSDRAPARSSDRGRAGRTGFHRTDDARSRRGNHRASPRAARPCRPLAAVLPPLRLQRGALLGLSQLPFRLGHRPLPLRRLDRDARLADSVAHSDFRRGRERALLPPSLRFRILRPTRRILRGRDCLARAAILDRRLCRALPRGVAIRARSPLVVGEPRQWRAVADALRLAPNEALCGLGPYHFRISIAALRSCTVLVRRGVLARSADRPIAERVAANEI